MWVPFFLGDPHFLLTFFFNAIHSGLSLFLYSPHRPIRAISLLYPLLILLVIMATANHYLLDAVGGFFVTVLAYRINRLVLNLRPLEEWFFWLIRWVPCSFLKEKKKKKKKTGTYPFKGISKRSCLRL